MSDQASNQELELDLEALLTELGIATVQVWRVTGTESRYLGRMDAAAFTLDSVQERWGGGRYRFRLLGGGKVVKQLTENIEGPPREPAPTGKALEVAPEVAPGSAPIPAHQVALERIQVGLERLAELLMARPAGAAVDPLDALTRAAHLLRELAPATAAPAPGQTDISQLMEMFDRGMRMGRQVVRAAEGGGGGGFGELISRVGVPLVEMAQQERLEAAKAAAGPQQPPAVEQQPAPAPQLPAAAPAAAVEPGDQVWGPAMRPYIPRLLAAAAKGGDADAYASVVLDQLPAPAIEALQDKALEGDGPFLEWAFGLFPRDAVDRYGAWLTDFVLAVHRDLTGADQDETEEEEAGDT